MNEVRKVPVFGKRSRGKYLRLLFSVAATQLCGCSLGGVMDKMY
jgi:hypothetical protein